MFLFFFLFKALDLLTDILRAKNNRQPAIILKAITVDSKDSSQARSILAELRDKAEPSKKMIIALSQKSLNQFLHDVSRNKQDLKFNLHDLFSQGTKFRYC